MEHIAANEKELDVLNLSLQVTKNSYPHFERLFGSIIDNNTIIVIAGTLSDNLINPLASIDKGFAVGAFSDLNNINFKHPVRFGFRNEFLVTTNIFDNPQQHIPFRNSSAYCAILTGIISNFLSEKYIPRSERHRRVSDYLQSISFDRDSTNSPFKLYKHA